MTIEYIQPDFEASMRLGAEAHRVGEYVTAFAHRVAAFDNPSKPEVYDAGRAARDMSASLDRMSDDEFSSRIRSTYGFHEEETRELLAEAYAEYAVRDHEAIMAKEGLGKGAREFTVSAMYAAISAARQDRGEDAVKFIDRALDVSDKLFNVRQEFHQYDVNLMGRAAGIKAIYEGSAGNTNKQMRKLGKIATMSAKHSETTRVLGHDPDLSPKQVKHAQHKALIRGVVARSLTIARPLISRGIGTKVAKRLLNKAVL